MEKIVITSDSGVCPLEENNMIPAQVVSHDGVSYRDRIEINNRKILDDAKKNIFYTTASPILADYEAKFRPILENGNDIIHLCMSSGISEGSYNASLLAANDLNEEYDNKVYVVDSFTGAPGGTLINELALNLRDSGMTTQDIINELENIKTRIKTAFYVPNPAGFIRSGRNKSELCIRDKALLLGAKTAIIAGIKFRVDFNNEGNLYVSGMYKGKDEACFMKLVKNLINEQTIENLDNRVAVIGNVYEAKVNMDHVKEYIESLDYFDRVVNKDIGAVVAAYGSEDLCGVSVLKKTR